MPKTRIVSPFPVFESIQETPHRQKGALSPFNCISIPQSRVCGKEKPFRICKILLRWCVLFYVFSEFFHFFRKKGLLFLLGFGIVYKSQGHARLAQLVEHLLDVQEVTGSSPVPRTITGHHFWYNMYLDWCPVFLLRFRFFRAFTLYYDLTLTLIAKMKSIFHRTPSGYFTFRQQSDKF